MNERTRKVLLWALLPIALLLTGVVNYFTGGLAQPAEKTVQTARLDFESSGLEREYRSSTILALRWGGSNTQIALSKDADGVPISTLEAIVHHIDGGFMLVDHPPSHRGARVRMFTHDGRLRDTVLTPTGSTLFTSVNGQLAYVVAKQSDGSERLVVRDGSREETFVVPLAINSGSIMGIDGDVWVTAVKTGFDATTQQVTATELAVPVVVDGKQVTDAVATEAIKEGWYSVGERLYTRDHLVEGHGETAQITQTLGVDGNETTLEIPGRSTPLGVDSAGLVYVRVVPDRLDSTSRDLAATLWTTSPTDEILVGGLDGAVIGKIVVPGSVPTVGEWSRFSLADEGDLLAAVSGPRGVQIVRYQAVESGE